MTTYIEFAFVGSAIVLGAIFLGPVSFDQSDVSIQQVQAKAPAYAPSQNQSRDAQITNGIFVEFAAPATKKAFDI